MRPIVYIKTYSNYNLTNNLNSVFVTLSNNSYVDSSGIFDPLDIAASDTNFTNNTVLGKARKILNELVPNSFSSIDSTGQTSSIYGTLDNIRVNDIKFDYMGSSTPLNGNETEVYHTAISCELEFSGHDTSLTTDGNVTIEALYLIKITVEKATPNNIIVESLTPNEDTPILKLIKFNSVITPPPPGLLTGNGPQEVSVSLLRVQKYPELTGAIEEGLLIGQELEVVGFKNYNMLIKSKVGLASIDPTT